MNATTIVVYRMLTGSQIRMARAYAKWTAAELADRAGVSANTVRRIEQHDGVPPALTSNLDAIKGALESGGVVFLDADDSAGPGVRLKKAS